MNEEDKKRRQLLKSMTLAYRYGNGPKTPEMEALVKQIDPPVIPEPPPMPEWLPDFKNAVFFLAGVYGAESVREAQKNAHDSGYSLDAEDIAKCFSKAAEYMTKKIQQTTQTGDIIKCPVCSKGYVYVGPGMSANDWERCEKCNGTGEILRSQL